MYTKCVSVHTFMHAFLGAPEPHPHACFMLSAIIAAGCGFLLNAFVQYTIMVMQLSF